MEVFPFASLAVSVTVLSPISLQSNVEGSTSSVAIPQLSEEPPSISAPTILALPVASNWMVISWQTAVGGVFSISVTVAVHVEEFPATSVTVNST